MVVYKCKQYEHHVEELEIAREWQKKFTQNAYAELAPVTEQIESETAEEQTIE